MLGREIVTESGKVTGMRILPGEGGRYVKNEVSFQAQAKVLGIDGTDMGTYTVYERIPGQLYGEGQGIIMTADGGAIWNGFGVGMPTGEGMGVKWAATITFQTNVPALMALNNMIGVVEHETDDDNNVKSTAWEWTVSTGE